MADGFSVDTSSYPRPVAPANPLDTMGKVIGIQQGQQNLQSSALTIDKQKLDLVNQRFAEFTKTLTGLRNDPDLNEKKLRDWATNQVKLGYVPPEMAGQFISQLPSTQGLPPDKARAALVGNIDTNITHAMTVKEALDYHLGQQGTINTGNTIQPIATSPKFGIRSTGLPIQQQLPPTQQGVDNNNQPAFAPPPAGSVSAPPPMPGTPQVPGSTPNMPLPVARPAAANSAPQQVAQQPNFRPSPAPTFEPGLKAYTADQDAATQKSTALKPLLLALDIIPKMRSSGPGTETWTQGMALLKGNGIIRTDTKDDQTALTQELTKYTENYLKQRGGRSDADLQAARNSSPNPYYQIPQALLHLAQTAAAQDRIEIARPRAFNGAKSDYRNSEDRQDYQNYMQHRSGFPQSMDERAFIVDKMTPDQKQELAKEIQKMKPSEKERFMRSLRAYEQTKVGSE